MTQMADRCEHQELLITIWLLYSLNMYILEKMTPCFEGLSLIRSIDQQFGRNNSPRMNRFGHAKLYTLKMYILDTDDPSCEDTMKSPQVNVQTKRWPVFLWILPHHHVLICKVDYQSNQYFITSWWPRCSISVGIRSC